MRLRLLGLLLLLAGASAAEANITGQGTDFWLVWPKSHADLEDSAEIVILSDQPANYQISGAFSAVGSVDAGAPVRLPIPRTAKVVSNRMIENRGIHVVSLDGVTPISVLLRVPVQAEASDDVAGVLPTGELGMEYWVVSYTASFPGEPSEYIVVATQDGTSLALTNPCGGSDNITLNRGQVYQVQCLPPADLTGAHIQASAPVAVFAGAADTLVPQNSLYGDFILEPMWPVGEWGTEFYTAPLPKGTGAASQNDLFRIILLAAGDITIESPLGPVVQPQAGAPAYYEFTASEPLKITTTAPAFLLQYHTGFEFAALGDPFMAVVPPTDQWHNAYRFFLPPDYSLGAYVSIVTLSSATGTVALDGVPVTGWQGAPGGTHSWLVLPLGNLEGEHMLVGAQPFCLLVHGYNDTYIPDPDLGATPGSYGYAAARSRPACAIFAEGGGDRDACSGTILHLDGGGTTSIGCLVTQIEYLWERNGVPLTGWSTSPVLDVPAADGTYVLRARCRPNPACTGLDSFTVQVIPTPKLPVDPDSPTICAGETVTLTAQGATTGVLWTTAPPGMDGDGATGSTITVSPAFTTVYTVTADDPSGCRALGSTTVTVIPDPVPGAIGFTLRLTRTPDTDDIVFTWRDLPGGVAVAGAYGIVAYDCPDRTSCADHPSPPVLDALPFALPTVAPGVESLAQTGGAAYPPGLTYYKVAALSPCSLAKRGASCNFTCSNPEHCYWGCP